MIDPDNQNLPGERESLAYEIQESIKPPILAGPKSQLKTIRESYFNNKMVMQMENLPIDDRTTSFEFWRYLAALDKKFKRSLSNEQPPQ